MTGRASWKTIVAACAAALSAAAFADDPPPAAESGEAAGAAADAATVSVPKPPKYQFLRWKENWSVLKDIPKDDQTDFWDPIKYIPLTEDGAVWMSLGGSTRVRYEGWKHFFFLPSATGDDQFLLWRGLLHADLHLGDDLRVYAEGKSALSTPRSLPGGVLPIYEDALALQQLFGDVRLRLGDTGATATFRGGRQEYSFGVQRLVSPLPWGNSLRTWDGATLIFKLADWDVTAFWSRFVPVRRYSFNTASRIQLYGAYATGTIPTTPIGLDLYFLGFVNPFSITFNGTTGREERYTFGGRLHGKVPDTGWDYDVEGAYQFGRIGPGNVSAFMIGSQVGYTAASLWSTPRFFIGFDYGSGDKAPGGDVQTFNQLFPLGHAYLGYIDVIGRQNIMDPNIGVQIKPVDKLTLRAQGHFFFLPSTFDSLYNAGGVPLPVGAAGASHVVGQEIDLTATYQFDRHLKGLVGYSHFFRGGFVQATPAPTYDTDFVYVQFEYTF